MGKFIEIEGRLAVSRSWLGHDEVTASKYEVSFTADENILELDWDSGDGCTALKIY